MINAGLAGETGAKPVRARRRKACQKAARLTGRHNPGKTIGNGPHTTVSRSEKAVWQMPSRNIRPAPHPLSFKLRVLV